MSSMLQRRWWMLLALAAAVVLLGWLSQRPADAPAATKPSPLPADLAITQLAVRIDSQEWRLEQHADAWRLSGDGAVRAADPDKVMQLLNMLRVPAEASYALDAVDENQIGLAPPRAILTVNGDITLRLGGNTAIGQSRYLASDTALLLVSPLLAYYVEQEAGFYALDATDR
ncbi:MAG: hypothetical protein R3217_04475 [Gammaproteobacteria bacterium]|nr:hypothetical protein [Gammaproteobacteria bacterium]